MAKDDEMFKLDPNGGPDKIMNATYGPKALRSGRGTKARAGSGAQQNKLHRFGGGVLVVLLVLTAVAKAFLE